jgi:radical SAM/Cys-rich protein
LTTELHHFERTLSQHGLAPLRRTATRTLQVNVGRLCDLACHHCHVEAGPARTEIMNERTADRVLALLDASPQVSTLDLTGGAPELNPQFRRLVRRARAGGRRVIDRSNLTVLFRPGQSDTPEFLADNEVHVIASLPCYTPERVDGQRGRGVFEASVDALQRLGALGYGRPGSRLQLDLVFNPSGAQLPGPQAELETEYRVELRKNFGIEFHSLLTITNMPIKRFAHQLQREGREAEYMSLLVDHFNPATVDKLMCRNSVSVSWDGRLFDCDFNQMLEMPLRAGATGSRSIWELESLEDLAGANVATAPHCFGCTAGAGSSCGGALL